MKYSGASKAVWGAEHQVGGQAPISWPLLSGGNLRPLLALLSGGNLRPSLDLLRSGAFHAVDKALDLPFTLLYDPKSRPAMAFMIYGASGYTGRLASEHAKNLRLDCILAGRTEMEVMATASLLKLPYRVFDLTDFSTIDSALQGVKVLLNCAGPFFRTAEPLMGACIRNGVDYLDIAAELDSFILLEKYDKKAREAGVMLLPGCGSSVAMLGCLAAHATAKVTNPVSIDIALRVSGTFSRGSATSAAENIVGCLQRSNDVLVQQDVENMLTFDFHDGNGEADCFPMTLPDLVTVSRSTGIRNIRTYVYVSDDALPTVDSPNTSNGPSVDHREQNPYHAAAVVTDVDGITQRSVLHTVNGYTFTSTASVEAAKRVLEGIRRPGFQTPVEVFGESFVTEIAGTVME